MSLPQNTTSIVDHPKEHTEREVLLHGTWLLLARVAWIVLTMLILTLNIVMIPRYYTALQANCSPGSPCFAISLTASDLQFLHQSGLTLSLLAAWQVILDVVSVLVCCALGALIFWRKSADRMALFCAFMLVLFGGAGFTSILSDTLAPLSTAWFILYGILDLLGQCSFGIFFFLFPSGRFVPRWTRWIALCLVVYWLYTIFFPISLYTQGTLPDLVFFALLLCMVGAQVYRYLRISTSRERQQTKWVIFGFSIGIVGFILVLVLHKIFLWQASTVANKLGGQTILYGFLLLIPISIAMAILRSRLYDIDVIINKALVYGLLTTLLAAVYAGLIFALQYLLGGIISQNNDVAIVISTLAIAALFQPLRHRIQAIIDRRFYRRKYDAAKVVDAFSATLRNEVDLNQLREHLITVVQDTMQPSHISLWLRESDRKHPRLDLMPPE